MTDYRTISVSVPAELVDEAGALLQQRGVAIDQAVAVFLRSLLRTNRAARVMELGDKLRFGKYRGETLDTIIRIDPRYVSWLTSAVDRPMLISDQAADALATAEASMAAPPGDEPEGGG